MKFSQFLEGKYLTALAALISKLKTLSTGHGMTAEAIYNYLEPNFDGDKIQELLYNISSNKIPAIKQRDGMFMFAHYPPDIEITDF